MRLADLKTPALVLDRAIVARNAAAMTARIRRHGVGLRPHMKTAKSIDVARLALDGESGGITVSTLKEADYFLGHGLRDITYAVAIVPSMLDEVATLERAGAELTILTDDTGLTDDMGVARAIAERGRELAHRFHVLIEIDTGDHRTGVTPDSDELHAIAQVLHDAEGTDLRGVLTHAGRSYHCRGVDEIRAVVEEERRRGARGGGLARRWHPLPGG